jgi:hypothetical protein
MRAKSRRPAPGAFSRVLCSPRLAVTYSTIIQRVAVDSTARTITWVTTVLGFRYEVETWAWTDVTAIEVVPNSRVRSQGRRADAVGTQGRRVVQQYFHHSPPREIEDMAREMGVQVIEKP